MSTGLTETQARRNQGRIMSLANQFAKQKGIDAREANRLAAEQVAQEEGFSSANELRRAIGKILLTSTSKHAEDPNQYKTRYRKLADEHDILPQDAVLMDAWGCADGTLSGIRSRLKPEGYSFKHLKGGMFEVTNRPRKQIAHLSGNGKQTHLSAPSAPAIMTATAVVPSLNNQSQARLPLIDSDDVLSELRDIKLLLERLVSIWS